MTLRAPVLTRRACYRRPGAGGTELLVALTRRKHPVLWQAGVITTSLQSTLLLAYSLARLVSVGNELSSEVFGENVVKDYYFVGKRFIQAFAIMFTVLALVYMGRGQQALQATQDAALWAGASAIVFALTVIYHRKTNSNCAVCVDAVE
jgi:hypothetical protein